MVIKKYGFKNWALYDNNGELVCVTVYKKGALEVARRLGNDVIIKKSSIRTMQPINKEGFYYV